MNSSCVRKKLRRKTQCTSSRQIWHEISSRAFSELTNSGAVRSRHLCFYNLVYWTMKVGAIVYHRLTAAAVLLWWSDTRGRRWNDLMTWSLLWFIRNIYTEQRNTVYSIGRSSDLPAKHQIQHEETAKNTENGPSGPCKAPAPLYSVPLSNHVILPLKTSKQIREKFEENLQNEDIMLADVQGRRWKTVSKGFICYEWLLARRITALHTNVNPECTSEFLKTSFFFNRRR